MRHETIGLWRDSPPEWRFPHPVSTSVSDAIAKHRRAKPCDSLTPMSLTMRHEVLAVLAIVGAERR